MTDKVAFLFDLDGVLVDSESEYTRIWQHIDNIYPTGVEDFTKKIKGTTLPHILDRYYPDMDVRAKVEQLLYEQEKKMVYRYCDGAKQLLDVLHEKGIPIALVTSSNDHKMQHLYHDIPEFRSYFDTVIDDHCVTKSKPDPQGYLLAANRLNINIYNCAVVEDSLQGVKAGRSSGAYVIGDIGTLSGDVLKPYCDLLVNNLREINVDNLIELLQNR
ncbi:MAG: HAD family phosphatase [Muribaculum sp.]|nr:HAD family phosphatase [Muribaculum sp.]